MAGSPADGELTRVDPKQVSDRAEFARQLSMVRERAGMTIRAIARLIDQPHATVGGYFSGQHLPGVSQTDSFRALLVGLGINDAQSIEEWVDALLRVRARPGPRPVGAQSPYRGLGSFDLDDAEWFFGREALVARSTARAEELLRVGGDRAATAFVGPSGSGKSSLIKAGVVASLSESDSAPGSDRWAVVMPGLGEDPLRHLAASLAARCQTTVPEVLAGLAGDPPRWPDPPPGARGWLVVLDQFEEVFTCADATTRNQLIKAVRTGLADWSQPGALLVIVGLRADFYAPAARDPFLVQLLQDNQILVGPMDADQLRRAIVEPARKLGMAVEPGLVELVLSEVSPHRNGSGAHEPGALPLISHCMAETWERARRGRMTVDDYRASGGIAGAVQRSAEGVYGALDADARAAARRIFLDLVSVDDAGSVTRRRLRRDELLCGPDLAASDRAVEAFVSGRLLTAREQTIEVSHEALLGAWPRLDRWIDDSRDDLRTRRQVADAAALWEQAGRDPGSLLRGVRLDVVETWLREGNSSHLLSPSEEAFVCSSREEAAAVADTGRRRVRRLRVTAALVSTLAVLAGSLAVIAAMARSQADSARRAALSREIALYSDRLRESDPALAAQLALVAHSTAVTPQARSALLDASAVAVPARWMGQTGPTALAVRGDGSSFASTLALDGTVQLFSIDPAGSAQRAGVARRGGSGPQLFALAYDPRGSLMAAGGLDNEISLWDVSDQTNPAPLGQPLGGFDGAVQSVAFSPDGSLLAGGGTAAGILRWDVRSPGEPRPLDPLTGMEGFIQTVAFSPDGSLLAGGGSDGTLRVWRGADLVGQAQVGPTTVNTVAFHPDGDLLAVGSKDATLRLFDVGSEGSLIERGSPLATFDSWVNSVDFDGRGRVLAAGSSDNTVRFWDLETMDQLEPTLTHPGPVTGVRFLAEGAGTAGRILTTATDGVTRLWDWPGPLVADARDQIFALSFTADGGTLAVFPNVGDDGAYLFDVAGPGSPRLLGKAMLPAQAGALSSSGAISPDGTMLAAGTRTGNLQLWDVTDPAQPRPMSPQLEGPTELIEQVAFSPSGSLVAATSDDGTVQVWDLERLPVPDPIAVLDDPESLTLGLEFSPDGDLLVATSADNRVWMWDISEPTDPETVASLGGFDNYAYAAAFSPDGDVLVAGSADRTLRMWDITDPRSPKPLGDPITGPNNYVYTVDFHPAGDRIAAGVVDGTVWQWDVSSPGSPQHLATLTAPSSDRVYIVAYSPDGLTLAGGDASLVRLWQTDPGAVATRICAAGDGITRAEWERYVPLPFDPPCG